jgi:hypothetical protein
MLEATAPERWCPRQANCSPMGEQLGLSVIGDMGAESGPSDTPRPLGPAQYRYLMGIQNCIRESGSSGVNSTE